MRRGGPADASPFRRQTGCRVSPTPRRSLNDRATFRNREVFAMKKLPCLSFALVVLAATTAIGLLPVSQAQEAAPGRSRPEARKACIPWYDADWGDCWYMGSCNSFWGWWCNLRSTDPEQAATLRSTGPKEAVIRTCGPFPERPDENHEQCVENALQAFREAHGGVGQNPCANIRCEAGYHCVPLAQVGFCAKIQSARCTVTCNGVTADMHGSCADYSHQLTIHPKCSCVNS